MGLNKKAVREGSDCLVKEGAAGKNPAAFLKNEERIYILSCSYNNEIL
jgi:hypothetical protein